MSRVICSKDKLTAIANAVRAKTGSTAPMTLDTMATEVGSIAGAGNLRGIVDGTVTELTADDLKGVTKIRDNCFQNCTKLASIAIPDTVTYIGCSALEGTAITSATIPNTVKSLVDFTFRNCKSLTSATIPNSVTTMGMNVFANDTALTSITIPNSVTTMGMNVFFNCTALISVTIGNSLKAIGNTVFNNCSALTTVTIEATTPPTLSGSAFNGCSKLATIYVPSASLDAYKSATNWSAYASKMVGY